MNKNKKLKILKKMREAKERKRLESDPPGYPKILPDLRKRIIIQNYDRGELEQHIFELYKTNRIDCYKVIVDGKLWKFKVGFSKILEGLRKSMPRINAFYGV